MRCCKWTETRRWMRSSRPSSVVPCRCIPTRVAHLKGSEKAKEKIQSLLKQLLRQLRLEAIQEFSQQRVLLEQWNRGIVESKETHHPEPNPPKPEASGPSGNAASGSCTTLIHLSFDHQLPFLPLSRRHLPRVAPCAGQAPLSKEFLPLAPANVIGPWFSFMVSIYQIL